jgi:hypothetical protein
MFLMAFAGQQIIFDRKGDFHEADQDHALP